MKNKWEQWARPAIRRARRREKGELDITEKSNPMARIYIAKSQEIIYYHYEARLVYIKQSRHHKQIFKIEKS